MVSIYNKQAGIKPLCMLLCQRGALLLK